MKERTTDNVSSSAGRNNAILSIAAAVVALVLCALPLLGSPVESARGRPGGTLRTSRRSSALRQAGRAASVYKLDGPVQLDIRVVRVELNLRPGEGSVTDRPAWDWKFPADALSPSAVEADTAGGETRHARLHGFSDIIQSLEAFGKVEVLHSGVCMLAGNEPTRFYSSRRIPMEDSRQADEEGAISSVQYRDLGQRFTVNLYGVDAQGRIDFSYDVNVSYIDGEESIGKKLPTFVTFNTQSRARVRDNETLVIQNIDGPSGLLVFMTPHVMK